MKVLNINPASPEDFIKLWPILSETIKRGETYPFPVDMSEKEVKETWFAPDKEVYMATLDNGNVVGTYYIKPNQPGLGSHICNAGFMISSQHAGKGFGTALGKHALIEAKKLGYKAMQLNLVVVSNTASVKIWKKLEFDIIGTIPQAFQKGEDLVDAYVMYKKL